MIPKFPGDGTAKQAPNAGEYAASSDEVKAVANAGIEVARTRLKETTVQTDGSVQEVQVPRAPKMDTLPPSIAEIRARVAAEAQASQSPHTAA